MRILPLYLAIALRLHTKELEQARADILAAVAKGAELGPDSIWPDPKIQLDKPQTKNVAHLTHAVLRLTPEQFAEFRAQLDEALERRKNVPRHAGLLGRLNQIPTR